MSDTSLKIGKKEAKIPLIQGGMGIGVSLGGLAGAVAKEGAVGIISSAMIGFREPDFETNTREENVRAIKSELEKARKIAPDGIVGFNIMVAGKTYEEHVRAAAGAGADIIISGAGLPVDLPKYVEGTDVAIAPIVSTEKSARVIFKFWDKKYHRMPDLLVIEGPMAGGHLGFSKEQVHTYIENGSLYDEEVLKILEVKNIYEEKYGQKIPAALAGGIHTKEKVEHAFSLGVDAVQVASRFVTTVECDADIRYKEKYIEAKPENIGIVASPVGMPGRAILNSFAKRVMLGEKIPKNRCYQCLAKCNPAEIPYCITQALIQAAVGNVDEALLFCGGEVGQSDKIETVKEVIESLMC